MNILPNLLYLKTDIVAKLEVIGMARVCLYPIDGRMFKGHNALIAVCLDGDLIRSVC